MRLWLENVKPSFTVLVPFKIVKILLCETSLSIFLISLKAIIWTKLFRHFESSVQHFPIVTYFANFTSPTPPAANQCCQTRNMVFTKYRDTLLQYWMRGRGEEKQCWLLFFNIWFFFSSVLSHIRDSFAFIF